MIASALLACVWRVGPAPTIPAPTSPPPTDPHPSAAAGVTDPTLAGLLTEHWEATMRRSPSWATRLGDRRFDSELEHVGEAAVRAARHERDAFLARARALQARTLTGDDTTTLGLFVHELATDAATDVCESWQWSLSARTNAWANANDLVDPDALGTLAQARAWRARIGQLPRYVDEEIDALRAGIGAGRTPDAESARRVVAQLEDGLAQDAAAWSLTEPVRTAAARAGPEQAALAVLSAESLRFANTDLRAAFARYHAFLRDELRPTARPVARAGVWALPDGNACYAALARRETSLDRSPAEHHATGLAELARIHAEMRALGPAVAGTDDLATLFARLREDPAQRFEGAEAILDTARTALDRATAAVPRAFGRLPVAACEVRAIPDFAAPTTHIAYYMPVPADGSGPGAYYVNTWQPTTRPRFEALALAFHESVPGHHLQIALAQEQRALPAFRRALGTSAFVEGWALYAERLADELGLYPTPADRMGMLSFDSWRAARLVVDTGIHDLRWTREQAESFLRGNTPLATNNIGNEVDRYITWPGQALAYKTGQLEILRLRREAEAALGPRFDRAAFHDALLGGGAVTLPVLEARMRAWVAAQAAPTTGPDVR